MPVALAICFSCSFVRRISPRSALPRSAVLQFFTFRASCSCVSPASVLAFLIRFPTLFAMASSLLQSAFQNPVAPVSKNRIALSAASPFNEALQKNPHTDRLLLSASENFPRRRWSNVSSPHTFLRSLRSHPSDTLHTQDLCSRHKKPEAETPPPWFPETVSSILPHAEPFAAAPQAFPLYS